MTEATKPGSDSFEPAATHRASRPAAERHAAVLLVPYPKIVFLYPTLIAALLAAIYESVSHHPLDPANRLATLVSLGFLGIMAVNFVILAFDFPRTTSLTLFFFVVAVVLAIVLLVTFRPEVLPLMADVLSRFRPLANAPFYWTVTGILAVINLLVLAASRFDYWEVRPNELLHHHGFLANLERFPAPNLQIEKEINDVFEYLLLRSGRLILQPSGRRAIVLDNVPRIKDKEERITRMLGALHVEMSSDGGAGDSDH
jgi:hypothetical protein